MRNTLIIVAVLIVAGIAIGFGAQMFSGKGASAGEGKVLAKVGSRTITVGDVNENFNLNTQQLQGVDVNKLYPVLVDQLIGQTLVDIAAAKSIPDSNSELRKELDKAKTQIRRNMYLEDILEEGATDEMLEEAYQSYAAQAKDVNEIRASHILVADEQKAKDLIAKLDAGADFATLAKENSKDPSASSGGDLGYFAKGEMVEPFSIAAFKLEEGSYSKTPVKTQFGWHVVKVTDKRKRPVPSLDDVRDQLANALRPQILQKHLQELREKTKIKTFFETEEQQPSAEAVDPVVEPSAEEEQQAPAEE